MRKFAILGFLLAFSPFFAHASLMGFGDGAGLYDETGKQLYTCFPDQTCVGIDNTVHTREELGVGPAIFPVSVPSEVPVSTPQTVYVPVYVPSNTGAGAVTSSPVVGGSAPVISVPTFDVRPSYTGGRARIDIYPSSPVIIKSVKYHYWNISAYNEPALFSFKLSDGHGHGGIDYDENYKYPAGYDSNKDFTNPDLSTSDTWHIDAVQTARSAESFFAPINFIYQIPGEDVDRTYNF